MVWEPEWEGYVFVMVESSPSIDRLSADEQDGERNALLDWALNVIETACTRKLFGTMDRSRTHALLQLVRRTVTKMSRYS